MKTSYVTLIVSAALAVAATFASPSASRAASDENCDDTTAQQFDCLKRVADRAATQLNKDWAYLNTLAKARNPKAIKYLSMGNMSFRNYVYKNCESEGQDALGGSQQDVIEQKCRRDTLLARHRLFERIGEAHPLGRTAEDIFGRPICDSYVDDSKPLEIGGMTRERDVEDLRKKLDEIGTAAAASGHYKPEVATLLRKAHVQAEALRRQDAAYTCLGILEAFCPKIAVRNNEQGNPERLDWLSRCQTELLSSFYKRATTRLRVLKGE